MQHLKFLWSVFAIATFGILCFSPLLHIIAIHANALYFYIDNQRWPYYAHPDPSNATLLIPLSVIYGSMTVLHIAFALIPLILGISLNRVEPRKQLFLHLTRIFILNYIIMMSLVIVDPFGFVDWIWD